MKSHKIYKNKQGGQAAIVFSLFFVFLIVSISIGFANAVVRQYITNSEDVTDSRKAITVTESGGEDAVYRIKNNIPINESPSLESIMINSNVVNTTITGTSNEKTITSSGSVSSRYRNNEIKIIRGVGASFHYGIQAGAGGINLQNNASINGNVYANGPLVGSGGNLITGDAVSAGATGSISGANITGNAYAHNIINTDVTKDAYYTTIDGLSMVSGGACVNSHCHPGSSDQPSIPLPISDATITTLETYANTGGSVTCSGGAGGTYTISANTTIGPKVIPCNLSITDGTITLTGPIWVQGNISVTGDATLQVSASNMDASIALIADGADDTNGSKITLQNNTTYLGSNSNPNYKTSYIVFISQNTSAENGGSVDAINISNNAGTLAGDILAYAMHGQLTIQNNASVTEVTAYKTIAKNNIVVTYNIGLVSLLFSSGPGGAWQIRNWKEIK